MKQTIVVVLLLVFLVGLSYQEADAQFLRKLRSAVSKASNTVKAGVAKVKRTADRVKKVVNTAKNAVKKVRETVGKIKDKVMKFARYGNHCGKGHGVAGVPVKDALDLACYHHDRCYEAFGFGNCGCDRDAIVEIKRAQKTKLSLKGKAAAKVGLIWLSRHGCTYITQTPDGNCARGINKNLKGSDNRLLYNCNTRTFTPPSAPNAKQIIAKFYGTKAPTTPRKDLDREVSSDSNKVGKLEKLLAGKRKAKSSGKNASSKRTSKKDLDGQITSDRRKISKLQKLLGKGKSVAKKVRSAVSKTAKRVKSAGKRVKSAVGKTVKRVKSVANKVKSVVNKMRSAVSKTVNRSTKNAKSTKQATRSTKTATSTTTVNRTSSSSKQSASSKKVSKVERRLQKQIRNASKASKKSKRSKKAKRGCGSGLDVSFSGTTKITIGNVKL